MEGQFEKYSNLIRKQAHIYSKKWGVEYEEMESQGFLIYCECLKTYDVSKNIQFSTYLYWELKRLGDFGLSCRKGDDVQIDELAEDKAEKILKYFDKNNDLDNFLEYSRDYLSEDAFKVLEWIVNRSWEKRYRCKPTIKNVMEKFNCSKRVAQGFWAELKSFWNNEGFCFYF